MRARALASLVLVAGLSAFATASRADTCTLPDPSAPYRLVFEERFDGRELDRNRWNTEYLWGPGVVINRELQYYVNRDQFGYDPFRVADGTLAITASKTPFDRSKLYLTRRIYSGSLIELLWRTPAGASTYEVRDETGTLVTRATNTAHLLRDLTEGIDYTYDVTALDGTGSPIVTERITVNSADRRLPSPREPFSLGVDSKTYSESAGVVLWDPPNRAGRFEVYRDGRLYRRLDSPNFRSLYEGNLARGSRHDYRVVAYDRCDEVIASGETTIDTGAGPTPPEPLAESLLIEARIYSENTGGIAWNAVRGATSYDVFDGASFVGNTRGRSRFVSDLEYGVERRFRVVALDVNGRTLDQATRVLNSGDDGLALSYQRFLSGVMTSRDSFRFRYGRVEMRARMPAGNGYWSAFWLLNAYYNQDQPEDPEIDIVEALGERPDRVYQVYHHQTDPDGDGFFTNTESNESHVAVENFSTDFHTYRVDWEPGRLVWYVDGVETKRVEGDQVSDEQMYLIANLAVGGGFPVPPDASTPFPGRFEIDFIRVWQR